MSVKIAVEPSTKFYNNIDGRNLMKKYSAPLHVLTHHIQYMFRYLLYFQHKSHCNDICNLSDTEVCI